MEKLARVIISIVNEEVSHYSEGRMFRTPIVGFANAHDPLYDQLDSIIGHRQIHPTEVLPDAQTVAVYFIPFAEAVTSPLRKDKTIVQPWSDAYTHANILLLSITARLVRELDALGVTARGEPPTNNYDPVNLTAKWAHKASAVIAGIGTFGLNRLIITKSGTAGRLGSVVFNQFIEPTKRPKQQYCLYYQQGKCKVCLQKCPTGALREDGYDRFRCNAYLDGKNVHDLEQGCGMCSSGPCAMKGFCGE